MIFGKIYSMYSVKTVLLLSIFLFELGSAVCGAAPTSISFIVGRAVAGVGAAGILAGSVSASLHYQSINQHRYIKLAPFNHFHFIIIVIILTCIF